MKPVYLDYNATTPVLPEAVDAMLPYLREHWGNPSSDHEFGAGAKQGVMLARAQVASLSGCDADEVFFTSGGTESNNLAIRGVATPSAARRHVITSVIEHPATANPCDSLEAEGFRITRVGVDGYGVVRVGEVRAALSEETLLVSLMHSNNEKGVLQPIAEAAREAHAGGASP